MIGMTNAGGGGSGVNLRVVGGTTQPTSTRENLVWVDTSDDITKWEVRYGEPSTPTVGDVWIGVGWDRTNEFNIIKKNGIYIKLVSCAQYLTVDGTNQWVRKPAYIYQNGTWSLFSDMYHPLIKTMTGESSFICQLSPMYTVSFKAGTASSQTSDYYGQLTQTGIHIFARSNSGTYSPVWFYIDQPVYIGGNFNTMRIVWNGSGSGSDSHQTGRVGLGAEKGSLDKYLDAPDSAFSRRTSDLSLNTITPGSYYIQGRATGYTYDNARPCSLWIEDIEFLNV